MEAMNARLPQFDDASKALKEQCEHLGKAPCVGSVTDRRSDRARNAEFSKQLRSRDTNSRHRLTGVGGWG